MTVCRIVDPLDRDRPWDLFDNAPRSIWTQLAVRGAALLVVGLAAAVIWRELFR